jgi:1-acyl-sn-glycerol-3-phosphate acyltransferase
MRYVLQQGTSLISALWVAINLSIWLIPLLSFSLVKIVIRLPSVGAVCDGALEFIYRSAVLVDSFWMTRVIGIRINIVGQLPDHPAPIVISNHQTWFDIPVIQHTITKRGPILKFLVKRQLVWVPIIGWICYALNFPRLNRGGDQDARQADFAAIKTASNTLSQERGALLIFAEGTRFSPVKQKAQEVAYEHLLNPRPGGLKIAIESAPADTPVVDLTVVYRNHETNFWRCLHGACPTIDVVIRTYSVSEISDTRAWLEARWQEKDQLLKERFD